MCGDLEEADSESERLYGVFLQAAQQAVHEAIEHRGGSRARIESQQSPNRRHPLADESLHAYMDGLFGDILSACIKDARRTDAAERYRVLASQSVVLARLAGFLTGYLDPHEQPLATSIEALMDGYAPRRDSHRHDQ